MLTDPATTSRWGSAFRNVVGYAEAQATPTAGPTSLSGVTAPDDYTVQIDLVQPDSGMLPGFMFISIMPEHILGTADRATITELPFWTTDERVGAGPFKFTNLVEGERVELVAHEQYHFGAPAIKNLNLLFFASAETSLAAFQQGSSLIAPMTINDVELIGGIDGAESIGFPAGVGVSRLQPVPAVSCRTSAFARRWRTRSTRRPLPRRSSRGRSHAVSTEIPYVTWTQPEDANPYDYDPEMAHDSAGRSWLDRRSRRSDFWYYYTDPITASVMEAMQQYLQAVGINTELKFDDGSGVRAQEIARSHLGHDCMDRSARNLLRAT